MKSATTLFVAIALILLVIACQPQAPSAPQTTPTSPQPLDSSAEATATQSIPGGTPVPPPTPVGGTPAAPTPEAKLPGSTLSPQLAKLLSRADEKVKSYEFYYAPPPDNLARDRYYVKGNKIHMVGYRVNVVKNAEYYDNLYFDLLANGGKGEVRAFCLGIDMRCKEIGKEFTVSLKDHMIKLPYQWLKEISYGDITGSESLFDRLTKKVTYVKDGVTYTQWIDEHSGLPLRVLIEAPGKKAEKYEFKDLAINSVDDSKLEPPK